MPHWERLAVRALGASETELTVVSRHDVGPTYTRITVRDEGFLARHTPFPTMWLRLWFTSGGRDHQRAFTVIDPRPDQGVFAMEFALHDGASSDWARTCAPGDTIRASLLGSTPPWQPCRAPRRGHGVEPAPGLDTDFPARTVLIGDPASLPAMNSLLPLLATRDVDVWFEYRDPRDAGLPLTAAQRHRVHTVHHTGAGEDVAAAVLAHWEKHPPAPGDRYWIAVEAQQNRLLTTALRSHYGVPRTHIDATAYWRNV